MGWQRWWQPHQAPAGVAMGVIPATCEVWIDGKRYRDGQPGQNHADPFVLEGVTITWGRENTIDQPDPATATFTIMDPPGGTIHFDATVQLGSTVVVWAALNGLRTVVFGGRITDLTASFDDDAGSGICDVVAADLLSDLANRFVGSEPWAMQPMVDRAKRILAAVSVNASGLTVPAKTGAVQVSRMDVDRQPAAQLLLDLAVSTGSVLWAAYDPAKAGPYLLYEDPSSRASLFALVEQIPAGSSAQNLFTRPSFEDGSTTSFSPTGCTLAVLATSQPAVPAAGSKLLRATSTVVGAIDVGMANAIKVPVTAGSGVRYRVAAYVRSGRNQAGVSAQLATEFRDAAGATVAGSAVLSPVQALPGSTATWFRLEVTSVATPAGAATLTFNLRGTAAAVGDLVDWDAIMVHTVAAAADETLPYFDGDSTDTSDLTYDWTGAQWASVSQASVPLPLWAPGVSATAGTPLSACNVLQDPTEWVRAVTDLVTRVSVRWLDQTTSPDPTERTVQYVSTADEKTFGARGVSTSTILTTSADATSLATGLQAAHKPSPSWQSDQDLAFALLGNVTRLGYAIALRDLPYWTPSAATVQLYIEGGVYRFEADDAGQMRWVMALVAAPATGLGGSLTYGKTDLSVRFIDVKRSVRYIDMVGVGAAGPTGPDWADIAGTWDQQTKRWADLP